MNIFMIYASKVVPVGNPSSVYGIIILFRFFLGVGLGGIYPLSATKSSEDSAGIEYLIISLLSSSINIIFLGDENNKNGKVNSKGFVQITLIK